MIAKYFTKESGRVKCSLCPHNCVLAEGEKGVCRVRQNIKGNLISLNYSKIVALNSDPVEKKPLYHFLPGEQSLSIAAMGCNLKCRFCQNSSISMAEEYISLPGRDISLEAIIEQGIKKGCSSISFTYSEPTVWYELMYDIAVLAKKAGLKTILVSNGFVSEKPLNDLIPFIDAANIDLKAFTEEFYKTNCNASLAPVLKTLKTLTSEDVWLEITTLLIENINSSNEEIDNIIEFILSLGAETPWHISRFFPNYKMTDHPPGKNETLYRVIERARKRGMKYIYAGNTGEEHYCSTKCPDCSKVLIERRYYTTKLKMNNGNCPHCSAEIPGIWRNQK